MPRFRCVTCGTTFAETLGTPMHALRHEESLVLDAAAAVLVAGQSLREAAKRYEVSHHSVKRWVDALRPHPELLRETEAAQPKPLEPFMVAFIVHGVRLGLIDAQVAAALSAEIGHHGANGPLCQDLRVRVTNHHGGWPQAMQAINALLADLEARRAGPTSAS